MSERYSLTKGITSDPSDVTTGYKHYVGLVFVVSGLTGVATIRLNRLEINFTHRFLGGKSRSSSLMTFQNVGNLKYLNNDIFLTSNYFL